jgi:hypothetical protein
MKAIQYIRILIASSILAALVIPMVGCSAGDENPVTPEKMEEIRNKQASERENFRPRDNTPPPTGN